MSLSGVQKGAIGQFAFLAAALVTGKGQIEVYTPAADNEGRDAEIRRHLRPYAAIGVQVKVAFALIRQNGWGSKTYMGIRFQMPEKKIQNDPRLWYFFAVYDSRALRFHDTFFLVRADIFHKVGRRGKRNGQVFFEILANTADDSHDRWTPYRHVLKDLGKLLLQAIDEEGLTAHRSDLPLTSDVFVLGSRRRSAARRRQPQAA